MLVSLVTYLFRNSKDLYFARLGYGLDTIDRTKHRALPGGGGGIAQR